MGTIITENSWIKHYFAAKPIWAQGCAYRARFPHGRMLFIDGNAGDGVGVDKDQHDFFMPSVSHPTPEILTEMAEVLGNADVCLCEKDLKRRAELLPRFRQAKVLDDHRKVVHEIRADHDYALWVSDPCGPKGHGIEHMRAVDQRVPMCDFVVIMNEMAVNRIARTRSHYSGLPKSRELYGEMWNPQWWMQQLGKRFLARSLLFKQSPGFHYRILIIANYLADAARRNPFEEIVTREEVRCTAYENSILQKPKPVKTGILL